MVETLHSTQFDITRYCMQDDSDKAYVNKLVGLTTHIYDGDNKTNYGLSNCFKKQLPVNMTEHKSRNNWLEYDTMLKSHKICNNLCINLLIARV